MKKQKFKAERSTEGTVFELAFLSLAIVVWVAILLFYNQAPDIIPTHFGPSGAPDAYGSKAHIFFPCILITVVAAFMMAGSYFPHSVNLPGIYLVNERQAALNTRLMRILGIMLLLLAGAVALDMLRGHLLFVLIMIVVVVLVCAVFIYLIYKNK